MELQDLIEKAGTDLDTAIKVCPHCHHELDLGSEKERWLNSRHFKVKIQVSELWPGGEHGLANSEFVIVGNLSQDDICSLGQPNIPASGRSIPTTEW